MGRFVKTTLAFVNAKKLRYVAGDDPYTQLHALAKEHVDDMNHYFLSRSAYIFGVSPKLLELLLDYAPFYNDFLRIFSGFPAYIKENTQAHHAYFMSKFMGLAPRMDNELALAHEIERQISIELGSDHEMLN